MKTPRQITSMDSQREPGSFRDPNGFLYHRGGQLYRQVNRSYQVHYDLLMASGLYGRLTAKKLLVSHKEVDLSLQETPEAYKVIQPELIPFISYPYEWSFSQLKDAALCTLAVQKVALKMGMMLKDASAYNIQFVGSSPILIDTLSFEKYTEGSPWIAYRQFGQHFLAPLALMANCDIRLGQLLRVSIDGIPLDLASRLLPWKTWLNFGLISHIHVHATAQKRYAGKRIELESEMQTGQVSRTAMLGLIDSLESTVNGLRWNPSGTAWEDYYEKTNYSDSAFDAKVDLVKKYLLDIRPRTVWDAGANTGVFSRLVAAQGAYTLSLDIDPGAVETNYLKCRKDRQANLLPLLMDFTNPSPGLGWMNEERMPLAGRGSADLVLALALVHHLAIANNVPLVEVARFFSQLSRWLVIEFIPKDDSQVQKLLASRVDIFERYSQEGFEEAFGRHFTLRDRQPVAGSLRLLYLYERK